MAGESELASLFVRIQADMGALTQSMNQAKDEILSTMSGVADSIQSIIGGAFAAAMALGTGEFVKAAVEQEDAELRVKNVIDSIGESAGITAQEIYAMATAFQEVTRFSDDAVENATALLLTIKGISGENVKEAMKVAMDVASQKGMDLGSATRGIGRAMADPGENLRGLQQMGVILTEVEKSQLKMIAATEGAAKAQKKLLDMISERGFGGAALKFGENYGGILARMKNSLGDAAEAVGRAFRPAVESLAGVMTEGSKVFQQFEPKIHKTVSQVIDVLQLMIKQGKSVLGHVEEWNPVITKWVDELILVAAASQVVSPALKLLGGSFGFLMKHVKLALFVIGPATLAIAALAKAANTPAGTRMMAGLKRGITSFMDALGPDFAQKVETIFTNVFTSLGKVIEDFMREIGLKVGADPGEIGKAMGKWVVGLIDKLVMFSSDWEKTWEIIKVQFKLTLAEMGIDFDRLLERFLNGWAKFTSGLKRIGGWFSGGGDKGGGIGKAMTGPLALVDRLEQERDRLLEELAKSHEKKAAEKSAAQGDFSEIEKQKAALEEAHTKEMANLKELDDQRWAQLQKYADRVAQLQTELTDAEGGAVGARPVGFIMDELTQAKEALEEWRKQYFAGTQEGAAKQAEFMERLKNLTDQINEAKMQALSIDDRAYAKLEQQTEELKKQLELKTAKGDDTGNLEEVIKGNEQVMKVLMDNVVQRLEQEFIDAGFGPDGGGQKNKPADDTKPQKISFVGLEELSRSIQQGISGEMTVDKKIEKNTAVLPEIKDQFIELPDKLAEKLAKLINKDKPMEDERWGP